MRRDVGYWKRPHPPVTAGCAIVGAICFLALPAQPQGALPANCVSYTAYLASPGNSSSDLFNNFANPPNPSTNSTFNSIAIPFPTSNGASVAGDLNATYATMFYSINNLNAWMASNNYCPLEVVVVANFPDTRYFAVTVNDMHYTATQHVSDADMDPAVTPANGGTNPFAPGKSYTGSQPYLIPISLGWVPNSSGAGATAGCSITPYEEDNLLDATQRHLLTDWNTNVGGPTVASGALSPHVVNTPEDTTLSSLNSVCPTCGPNTAGSIVVRSYLAPPETCSGTDGSSLSCNPPTGLPPSQPYLIVRDTLTGCPYTTQLVNTLLNTASINCQAHPNQTGCSAILSKTDPSGKSKTASATNWLDSVQKAQHTNDANYTSQGCYANGDPTASSPPQFANRVAWTRVAQWEGSPGPDDAYIGGAVSTTDLSNMAPNTNGSPLCKDSSNNPSTSGCLMRLRFQVPVMPNTPCYPGSSCQLSGSEQMRYTSLTLWQQTATAAQIAADPSLNFLADPDGADFGNASSLSPTSVVSLADPAFCTTTNGSSPCYATLLINVGIPSASLPAFLRQTSTEQACSSTPSSSLCGIVQGTAPVQPPSSTPGTPLPYFSASSVGGYTFVNLASQNTFSTSLALLFTMRNTLPSSGFNCSGAAVPFSTAEFTNEDGAGGGLMGPYVPLVDYVDPATLPTTAPTLTSGSLPSANSCGVLIPPPPAAAAYPLINGAGPTYPILWPQTYWPSSSTNPPNLNCGTTTTGLPTTQIDFVATQFPIPVDDSSFTGSPTNCNTAMANNTCSQIVAQSTQVTEEMGGTAWQPGLPITIVGQGFGTLTFGSSPSQAQIPAVVTSSTSPSYLTVYNCGGGTNSDPSKCAVWTAPNSNCEIFVSNWTDSSVSFMVNLPVNIQSMYQQNVELGGYLSPLSDYSPLNFAAASACSISGGDNLYFKVTNPQTGAAVTSSNITAKATGYTSLN